MGGGISKRKVELTSTWGSADSIFAIADADGDGFITRDELQAALSAHGRPPEKATALMSAIDENKDDLISHEEMGKCFCNSLEILMELIPPPESVLFSDIKDPTRPTHTSTCIIEDTEERAISLSQLEKLLKLNDEFSSAAADLLA